MIKLNPFSRTVFNLGFYSIDNVPLNQMQAFLISIPESANTFGFEWSIDKVGKHLRLFSHSPLVLYGTEDKRPDYQFDINKASCVSVYPDKSSIYSFKCDMQNMIDSLQDVVKENELIILQLVLQKRSVDYWKDELISQYKSYLQGIETPTSNIIIKYVQHKLLDLAKKIDPQMNNPRLPESEEKFNLDCFRYCIRAIIQSETEESRKRLYRDFRYVMTRMNIVNKWLMHIEKKTDPFYRMFFNRVFPALHSMYQVLSTKELLPLLSTEIEIENSAEELLQSTEIQITEPYSDTSSPGTISLFSHMERGKKKNRETDINLAQKMNSALRKLGLIKDKDVVIQNIQHGATIQRITFSLPEGLKLSDLSKQRDNIQTELALNNIGIEQGELAGTATLTVPQEEREAVYLRDCAESDEFTEFRKKAILPFILGNADGKVVFECLTRIKHLLIAGSTGSGKSVFLNAILLMLMILRSPSELKFVMIDPKRVELRAFKAYGHVIDVYTDMEDAVGALCYAVEEMEKRYEKFEKSGKGYRNIQQYNKNEPEPLPYIVIVIDELSDLIMTHPESEDYIVRLAQMARAAGIHLIIATQRPQKEVLTGLIKSNIVSRVCFACDSSISYRVALDETPKFTLLGKGDGVYRFEGIQGLHRFQGALIASDDDKQDDVIKKYAGYWKGDFKKNVIDMTALRNKALEQELFNFKKLILSTGEMRIGELKKIMQVRDERIKSLMEQLMVEGWVIKHKSKAKGYELILSEDEKQRQLSLLNQ